MSCRTVRSRRLLSSCPVAIWKRRLNSSSLASRTRSVSSSSVSSRSSAAVVTAAMSDVTTLTGHDPALHGQLVDRPAERLASGLLVRVAHLEQHPTRLHVRDPLLRGALAGTHPGLGRLLGQRAVREDVDPDLATAADVPVDGDTRGLDLA